MSVLIPETRATKFTGGNPADPAYWVKKLWLGKLATDSGIEIDEDTILTFSAVWAAVNIISGAIGFLPFNVYKRIDEKKKERVYNHPVYTLLHDRPNKYMSAQDFREILQSHILLWGNCYAEIERDKMGTPTALWPVLPNRIISKIINGILLYDVRAANNISVTLQANDILHCKGLGFDGLKGYSVIEYMANNVALGVASEKYSSKFFANDSTPAGLLQVEGSISKETKDELKKEWEIIHKGTDKQHQIAVMHSGLKYQSIGIPAKDAQLIESRKFSIIDVARWFSIPPHLLRDLDRATFSNIEHQGIEFVTFTLMRWLKKWEHECRYKFFDQESEKDYFAEFNVDGLLRGDIGARYTAYNIGRQAGFLCVNDIREKENMDYVEGGDTFLEPLNMQPVGTSPVDKSDELKNQRFYPVIYDSWRRIITKEVKALRTAPQNPVEFKNYAKDFYVRHTVFIEKVLLPVLSACFGGTNGKALEIGQRYAQDRMAELETATDINKLLDDWENKIPIELTKRILDMKGN